jgi:tetratricopeptide (TPR) repeat protein
LHFLTNLQNMSEPNTPSVNEEDLQTLLLEGSKHYERGELGDALRAFNKAIDVDPLCESTYLWLGAVHRAVGKLEDCLVDCDNALRIYPNCAQTLDYKATCLIDLGRFSDALNTTQQALDIEDDDVDAFDLQGIALRWLGKPEEARRAFDRALEIDSSAEYVHIHRCTTLHDLGRTEEALRVLENLTKEGPCHVLCLTSRAIVLRDLGRFADADQLFDAARMSSKIAFRQFALAFGQRLYHSRQYREALTYFQRYMHPDVQGACDIQEANVYYYCGLTLSNIKYRGKEAISRFERAAVLDPDLIEKCNIAKENVARFMQGERTHSCTSFYDILILSSPGNST